MENIKLELEYTSGYCNGWPLISIAYNHQWVDSFEANSNIYCKEFLVHHGEVYLEIEHWGKNPITDSNPDKFFQLLNVKINGLYCSTLLENSYQTIKPTPWNPHLVTLRSNTYLGHNGSLILHWASPFDQWVQQTSRVDYQPIQGQHTTREVLEQAKKFFKIQSID